MLCGQDLDQRIDRGGAVQPLTAAKVGLQACRGLMAAHACNLVHRDVKPGNLFLHQQPNGELVVKVCDFGIVKQLGTEHNSTKLTSTGGLIGSPTYMSPEQATNAKLVDARSDIWSLGASLYQALSGSLPFPDCETVGELILSICTRPVVHLQDRAPWVPPALAEIVHKAMQRDAAQRYQTMTDMAAALEAVVGVDARLLPRELGIVDPHTRSQTAARAVVQAGTFNATTVSHPHESARGRFTLPLAATVATIALLAGGGLFFGLREGARGTSNPIRAASDPPSTTQRAKPYRVRVAIRPANATVTVAGTAQVLSKGFLVLRGVAGDRFEVVATLGEHKVEQAVIIGKDGRPSIDTIDVAAVAAAASASAAAAARASATRTTPTQIRTKRPSTALTPETGWR